MLTVACVLKSGGDYDWSYVAKLRRGLELHLTIPYTFICYTDVPREKTDQKFTRTDIDFHIRKLESLLKGCWAKLEVFRSVGEVFYLDLDTVIVKNINNIIQYNRNLSGLDGQSLAMLSAFKKDEMWASGLMYWNGDFNWVKDGITSEIVEKYGHWDQRYIKQTLLGKGMSIRNIWGSEIKSYKWDCMEDGIPDDAKIVCFHGKPRPKDTNLWEMEQ
jgi:hypothetical protein